jgi:porphobilinogen synthase
MGYPDIRLRRLRKNAEIRNLVKENFLSISNFMYPVFLIDGKDKKESVKTMPGVYRFSLDLLLKEIKEAEELGIKSILLFGVSEKKYSDKDIDKSYLKDNFITEAIKEIKSKFPKMVLAVDVCLCAFTQSGHCGLIKNKTIDNDLSLKAISKTALSYAKAGADMVAPSAMMDGMVGSIRKELDENDFKDTLIMSYSAKYASSFYGPFRDIADSAPSFGDRKTYQMPSPNSREAMREIELDIEEGADIVMIKPALSYLDIICKARERFDLPIAAYSVSGEYSMVKFAANSGALDEKRAILEIMESIKRAGANIIITYFAKEMGRLLNE